MITEEVEEKAIETHATYVIRRLIGRHSSFGNYIERMKPPVKKMFFEEWSFSLNNLKEETIQKALSEADLVWRETKAPSRHEFLSLCQKFEPPLKGYVDTTYSSKFEKVYADHLVLYSKALSQEQKDEWMLKFKKLRSGYIS